MHDIDKTMREQEFVNEFEFENEFQQEFVNQGELEYSFENGQNYEFGQEFLPELSQEFNNEFQGESHNMLELELTNELLEVTNQQELNHFVGNLISKVSDAAKGFIQTPTGQSVGKYLVNFAQNTLPQLAQDLGGKAGGALGEKVGTAVGKRYGGRVGGMILGPGLKKGGEYLGKKGGRWIGTKAGNWAAAKAKNIFNLELEGLNAEDQEFEIARSFVRFASDVARRAHSSVRNNPNMSLPNLSRSIITRAAQNYAPGLLAPNYINGRNPNGTWYRRGNNIILQGA